MDKYKINKRRVKPFRFVALLAFLTVCFLLFLPASVFVEPLIADSNEQSVQYNDKGVQYFLDKKYAQALHAFRKAIQVKPDDGDLYYNMALCYEALGNIKQAKEHYRIALELNSKNLEAYNNLGILYFKDGNVKKARELWEKALQIDPSYEEAGHNLARFGNLPSPLEEKKKSAKSESTLDEIIKLLQEMLAMQGDDPSLYKFLGVALLKKEKYEESAKAFEKAGAFPQQDGSDADFEEDLKQILKGDEKNSYPNLYYTLGILFKNKGEIEKASQYFQKVLQLNPSHVSALGELADTYFLNDNYAESKKVYEAMLSLKPNDAALYTNLGIIDFSLGQKERSIQYFQKAAALEPDEMSLCYNLGHAYAKTGKYAEALRVFLKILPRAPSALLYYNVGILYEKTSDAQNAILSYRKALSLNPELTAAKNNLTALLLTQLGLGENAELKKKGFILNFISE